MPLTINQYFKVPKLPGLIFGAEFESEYISGTTITGKGTNGINPTIEGSPVRAETAIGPAYTFTPANTDRLKMADNDVLTNTSEFTNILVVKRLRDDGSPEPLFAKYGAAANFEYISGILANVLYFWTYDSVSAGYRGRTTAAAPMTVDGIFHLLVLRKQPGTATTDHSIWLDNTQIDAGHFSAGGYTQIRNGTEPLYLGFCVSGLGVNVYGNWQIASFSTYNRALTTTEMTNIYNTFNQARTRATINPHIKVSV